MMAYEQGDVLEALKSFEKLIASLLCSEQYSKDLLCIQEVHNTLISLLSGHTVALSYSAPAIRDETLKVLMNRMDLAMKLAKEAVEAQRAADGANAPSTTTLQ